MIYFECSHCFFPSLGFEHFFTKDRKRQKGRIRKKSEDSTWERKRSLIFLVPPPDGRYYSAEKEEEEEGQKPPITKGVISLPRLSWAKKKKKKE